MVDIQWNNSSKQQQRISQSTINRNVSSGKNDLLGWVLPTSRVLTRQDKYNVFVPDLGRSTLQAVPKVKDGDSQAYNGVGRYRELEVGQPVVISFLGNKNKPIISYLFHHSVPEPSSLDVGEGKHFPSPGNAQNDYFSLSSDIQGLTLGSNNLYQPVNSPANNIIPGAYTTHSKDGHKVEFTPNSSLSFGAENYFFTEGVRLSTIDRSLKSADAQAQKLPYEISKRLGRVYRIASGEFIPDRIRERDLGRNTNLGDVIDYLFAYMDPVLERLEYINDFVLGIEEFYDTQIEWFESSIIRPAKELYQLWESIISEGDILGLFGYEALEININYGQILDNLFSNIVPNSKYGIVNLVFGAAQWALKEALVTVFEGFFESIGIDLSTSFSIGGLVNVVAGGGGTGDPNRYRPDKGSIISITPPTIFSEGSPLVETLKFGKNVKDSISAKSRELGFLISDVNNLVDAVALAGSNSDFYTDSIRESRTTSVTTNAEIIIPSELMSGESLAFGLESVRSVADVSTPVKRYVELPYQTELVPVVDPPPEISYSFVDQGEAKTLDTNDIYPYQTPEDSTPVISVSQDNDVFTGGVVLNNPSQINREVFTVTAQVTIPRENEIILELLNKEKDVIDSKPMKLQSDNPDYDLYTGALPFPTSSNEIEFYYRARSGNYVWPTRKITRPTSDEISSNRFDISLVKVTPLEEGYAIYIDTDIEEGSAVKSINLKIYNYNEKIKEKVVPAGTKNHRFVYETDSEKVKIRVKATSPQYQDTISSRTAKISNGEVEGYEIEEEAEEVGNYADVELKELVYYLDTGTGFYTFDLRLDSSRPKDTANIKVELVTETGETLKVSKQAFTSKNGVIRTVILSSKEFEDNEGNKLLIFGNSYEARVGVNLGEGIIYSEWFEIEPFSNKPKLFAPNSQTNIKQPFLD